MKELEVFTYDGSGYNPTMHFDSWRVAFLNYAERFDRIEKLERHLLTDEVFVLLSGKAVLLLGEKAQAVNMETGKIYNVKKGVWHAIKVTPDAKILIVENHNTGFENTQYMSIDSSIGANIVL
jgi:mannose-6-phosphate isomerase-like protein (cupin superfamily)